MSLLLTTLLLIIKHLIIPMITILLSHAVRHVVIEFNCLVAFKVVRVKPLGLEFGLKKDVVTKELVVDCVACEDETDMHAVGVCKLLREAVVALFL